MVAARHGLQLIPFLKRAPGGALGALTVVMDGAREWLCSLRRRAWLVAARCAVLITRHELGGLLPDPATRRGPASPAAGWASRALMSSRFMAVPSS